MPFPGRSSVKNEPTRRPSMSLNPTAYIPTSIYANPPPPPLPHPPSRNPFRSTTQREAPRPRAPMSISRGGGKARNLKHKHHAQQQMVERDWSTDLYDCLDPCDTETCMQATFCPCVVYGNNRRRYEHLHSRGYPHPVLAATKRQDQDRGSANPGSGWGSCFSGNGGGVSCPCLGDENAHRTHHQQHNADDHDDNEIVSGPCLSYALSAPFGIGFILQAITRGHIRMRYRIKGSGCGDFVGAVCCGPCQLVQESKELEVEEASFVLERVDVRNLSARMGVYM